MRWKTLFFSLALLGAFHFAACTIATKAFNAVAQRVVPSGLSAHSVSLDLINGSLAFQNLQFSIQDNDQLPSLECRNILFHWSTLALLSKQFVIEDITITGLSLTTPALLVPAIVAKMTPYLKSHAPDTKPAEPTQQAFRLEKKGKTVWVHYPNTRPGLLLRDFYLSDVQLNLTNPQSELPPLPKIMHLNFKMKNTSGCLGQLEKPMEYDLQARLDGHDAAIIKAKGSILRTKDGHCEGTSEWHFEALDIAKLWPWIDPAWIPQDLSPFQVASGLMDLTMHITGKNGHWDIQNDLVLRKLSVRARPGSEQARIKGASAEMVVDAMNTLGDIQLRFSSYREFMAAFQEQVMKGVRNLIRKSIRDAWTKW